MYSGIKHITKKSVPPSYYQFCPKGEVARLSEARARRRGSPQLLRANSPPPEGGTALRWGGFTPLTTSWFPPPRGEKTSRFRKRSKAKSLRFPRRYEVSREFKSATSAAPAGRGFPGGHPRTPAHSVFCFPSRAGASSY